MSHSSTSSSSEAHDDVSFNKSKAIEYRSGVVSETPIDHVTRIMSRRSAIDERQNLDQTDPEVISKVETLARTLSKHRARDGPLQIDPNDFDAAAILSAFVRDSEEQGIHIRKSGVIAEDVSVTGVDARFLEGQTFGDILMLPRTIFRGIRASRHKKMRKIIQGVNLLALPGEMILVLGRPGAGCSSFLRTISGEVDQFPEITGDISYDGIPQKDMMKKYKPDVIYNGEMDVHFPHLTVKQTLDFALACKVPSVRVNNASRKQYIASMRELYATIFGLRHTYNTKVGNDFVRGVSGGERKRVSIAEALAARGSIYCWDNATRGLDASTALEYAQAIRIMTNLLRSTALVTIYQASENIYETFDKVTVLYEGRQIYFGTVTSAKGYFEKMGFMCPPRQATAEFLTALTDADGLHDIKPGYENKVPRTAAEFEAYWRASPEFSQLKNEIEAYKNRVEAEKTKELYDLSLSQEKSKYTRSKSYFTISYFQQVKLCTTRGFQRIYGDKAFTITNTVAAIVQSLVTGSLFYSTPSSTSGAFSRSGVLYFSVLYYSLMGLANISFEDRPILQKHKTYSLYHPSAEALASTISAFPFRMIGLTCFLIILYFLSGLTREAGRFFIVYLFLTICSESITALFEMVTAISDSISQANSISGILMMAISLYSTYMIQLPSMHPWFKWIAYILPIRYTFESMLSAEFHNRKMDCGNTLVPSGPGYQNVSSDNQVCAFIGSKEGQAWVLGDDYLKLQYEYKYSHVWRNLGIMFAFLCFYLTVKCLVTEFKRPIKGGGDALLFKKGTRNRPSPTDEESSDNELTIADAKKVSSGDSSAETAVFEGLRSEGVFLWKDVCYTIPFKGGQRQLLDNISGYCAPGTLTALMGESGAGKTTLLNTLAQRNVGIITGDMLVNGSPIDASFERRTGYVQQQDIHIKEMTVRESLQFSARMRRPESIPDSEKMSYVEKLIEILGMQEYADALVGDVGYGLNVEQRKKLSIGVELAAKPNLLLFLDEPTSGLDSQASWAIVQLLKKLAQAGQSILCTIHQPSATLFEQFDRLLLLKKGGQTVYFGPIGEHSRVLLDYFERNGARQCEDSENPAEYILESIGAGATASVKEDWHLKWKASPEFQETNTQVETYIKELFGKRDPADDEKSSPSKYATSYFYQFRYVWLRSSVMFWRDVNYIMSKMMLFLVGGLFIGFTFYNVGSSFTGLQNAMFAAFMAIVLSAPAMNQIQARALASRELFEVRESKSNMFHWSFLLLTQYLTELPYHLFFSTVFFVSFYFPLRTDFAASKSGVFFLDYCIMFQLYFVGLGLAVLYMSPNLPSANVILGLCLSFLISFCGIVQPSSLMPGFWTFMWKVSPYTYFAQNLIGIMLHDKKVVCKAKEYSYLDPPTGKTCGEYMEPFLKLASGYVKNPDATEKCAYCTYRVGDEYLKRIGSSYSYMWRNFGFFWVYIIFNLAAMVVLYYLFHVRKISLKDSKLTRAIMSKVKKE